MSGRVASDIQTRAEGEWLYISRILYQIYNHRHATDFLYYNYCNDPMFLTEILYMSFIESIRYN